MRQCQQHAGDLMTRSLFGARPSPQQTFLQKPQQNQLLSWTGKGKFILCETSQMSQLSQKIRTWVWVHQLKRHAMLIVPFLVPARPVAHCRQSIGMWLAPTLCSTPGTRWGLSNFPESSTPHSPNPPSPRCIAPPHWVRPIARTVCLWLSEKMTAFGQRK